MGDYFDAFFEETEDLDIWCTGSMGDLEISRYTTREGVEMTNCTGLPSAVIEYSETHPKQRLRGEIRCDAVVFGYEKGTDDIVLAPYATDLHYIKFDGLDQAENFFRYGLAEIRFRKAMRGR